MTQVYTGEGKGKTSAAVGLALRALSRGRTVAFLQFFKPLRGGELDLLKEHRPASLVLRFPGGHPAFQRGRPARRNGNRSILFRKDLARAARLIKSGRYDIVILDEILIALRDGLLDEAELINLVSSRPGSVELVLTGRGATPAICRAADLVTEMRSIKHPFDSGQAPRKGIEY
ncbi:MAG TPA: cob(I)yrinic acid a,c-diamide adenosyltransferase [bacterium]|nr:cob(I)yrinic acid a,c-diamide adenosyltransferase [bacterium]